MARRPSTSMGFTPGITTLSLASLVLAASCSFASAFAFAPSFRSGTRVQHHNAAARRHPAAGTAAAAAATGTTGAPTTMVATEPVAGLLKTVTVELEDRSYPIYIGEGILDRCVWLKLRPCCTATALTAWSSSSTQPQPWRTWNCPRDFMVSLLKGSRDICSSSLARLDMSILCT